MYGGDLLYKPHDQCYSCIYIPPVSFCCSYCCISVSSLQFLSKKLLISYIFSNSIFLNDSAENLMDYMLHYFPNHSVNSKKITNKWNLNQTHSVRADQHNFGTASKMQRCDCQCQLNQQFYKKLSKYCLYCIFLQKMQYRFRKKKTLCNST